jgi:beta-phosphoglucomutase-like phosphatase (HAD superfamily)
MNNSIEAYFFDLDGTLVNTEPMWVSAIMASLNELSCKLSKTEADEMIYGRSWLEIYEDLCRLFPGVWADRMELEERIEGHFNKIKQEGGCIITSSVELLKKLSEKRPVAVVSGSSAHVVGEWISELGLEDYVQFHLGCEDYPHGKPDPICYQMAAERLGVSPESCLVFEDSTAGVKSAKSAGMYCVAISLIGSRQQELGPADLILNDLADLDIDALDENPLILRQK